jgi:DNA-binding transcriptional ArsR family regulator
MTAVQPARARSSSQRVRNGKDALLDNEASALVQSVRDIICEPTRTQIVRALTPGPLAVGEIASILGRSKSATSQHLRVLRDGGIVTARRRGRVVMYALGTAPMIAATVGVLEQAVTLASAA